MKRNRNQLWKWPIMLVGISLTLATTPGREYYGMVQSSTANIEIPVEEQYFSFSVTTEMVGEWDSDVIHSCGVGLSLSISPNATGEMIIWRLYEEWDQEAFDIAYAEELENPENDSETWDEYSVDGLNTDNAVLYKTMRIFGNESYFIMDDGSSNRPLFDTSLYEIPLLWDVPFAYDSICGNNTEHFVLTFLDSQETYSIAIEASVAQSGFVNMSPIGCTSTPEGTDVEFEVTID